MHARTSWQPPDLTPVAGGLTPLESVGKTRAAPDPQVAVHARQMDLDRLRGHVERAGDVAVALAGGRHPRDPPLARRQRLRAAERLAPRAATRGVQLVPGMLGQRLRTAVAGDLERVPQRRPRVRRLACDLVTSIDPATRTAQLANGGTLPYDLFVGIPIHRAPDPLAASGLAVNGWVPVDQTNLRTQFPQVYALGDVCTGPRTVPKAGIFAESAALVVADDIAAAIAGVQPPAPYEASGVCYAEFGGGFAARSR